MNQTTAFSPPLCVRLLDGTLARFARSSIDHWVALCEQYKAELVQRRLAEVDAIPPDELKPVARAAARAEVWEMEVPIGPMTWRCQHAPQWIKAHLVAAFREAGGDEQGAAAALAGIPWQQQQEVAHEIATLPVVKNNQVGTEANPLVAGVEFASTGASPSSSSSEAAPASASAA